MANAKRNVKKVVLAYSGGLDTSIIIPWLKENYGGAEVIAFCGDVGQGDDFEAVRQKALATGASKCIVKDLREEFVRDYCFKALSAGRRLRGPLPARHRARAPAARLPPGAGRRIARRRRRAGPRRHRQGQRPGPLRGHLRRLRPAPAGDRARGASGRSARARTRSPTRASTACPSTRRRRTSSAATATSGTSRTRAATSRTSGTRRRRGCSSSPWTRSTRPTSRASSRSASSTGVPVSLDGKRLGPVQHDRDAQPDRGRPRRGPARPRREPARRHQVARRLRDAGRHRAPHRAPRARAARARPRHAALQAGASPCATRSSIYDGLWFSTLREALAGFVDETEKEVTGEVRVRLYKGTRRGGRPPLAAQPLPPGPRHLRRGHGLRPPGRRGLHPPLRPARAGAGAHPRPRDRGREGGRGDPAGAARGEGQPEAPAGERERHRPARLPRRGRGLGHQARPPRPRARWWPTAPCAGGRRLHHQPRPGGAGPGLARAPGRRPGAGDRRRTPAARTPAPARAGSPTRARWPRSRRARSAARSRRSLVASTGVIGVRLPMDEGARGHRRGLSRLSRDGRAGRGARHHDDRHEAQGGGGRVPGRRRDVPWSAGWPRAPA